MSLPDLPAPRPHPTVEVVQGTFDELGTPLADVTFVVVDLETTGASPAGCLITEIGAVKVRGGVVLGEFQTLVQPSVPIPPFIAVLTGITDAMVATAPRIGSVLPAFLEFARGAVLVAHNAPFDTGFLRAACAEQGLAWPDPAVLDTARLARCVVTRDEAPNCKLATLARVFRSSTTPNHRALADARATVDVLHGLLERVGALGVCSLEELATYSSRVSPAQRRKRYLADAVPAAPGVYLFTDGRGRPLYVGKSTNMRGRVRQYFTASEQRTRMAEMVGIAESVTSITCATPLEAEVRELRLIAEHKPRYNRRSRHPEKATWVKLTVEPFPRLSLVRRVKDDAGTYLGPFASSRVAEQAMTALHEAVPLRQCSGRLSLRRRTSACVLAEMKRCGAPCDGRESPEAYAAHVALARAAMLADARPVVEALTRRIEVLAARERYEDAAAARDRLAAFVRTAARLQRLSALAGIPQLVAARPDDGGWELTVVRYGRLAGAARVPRGVHPRPAVDALLATAAVFERGVGPVPASTAAETECIARWLDTPGVRLVELDGEWCSPAYGAGRHRDELEARVRRDEAPWDSRRNSRPVHRPVAALGV